MLSKDDPSVKRASDLIQAITDLDLHINSIEPRISKCVSDLDKALSKPTVLKTYLSDNTDTLPFLLNRDILVITALLYRRGMLDCNKPTSEYKNATKLLDLSNKDNIFARLGSLVAQINSDQAKSRINKSWVYPAKVLNDALSKLASYKLKEEQQIKAKVPVKLEETPKVEDDNQKTEDTDKSGVIQPDSSKQEPSKQEPPKQEKKQPKKQIHSLEETTFDSSNKSSNNLDESIRSASKDAGKLSEEEEQRINDLQNQLNDIDIPELPSERPSDMSVADYRVLKQQHDAAMDKYNNIQEQISAIYAAKDAERNEAAKRAEAQLKSNQLKDAKESIAKFKFPNISEDLQSEAVNIVEDIVEDIISDYDILFSDLYQDTPVGVLTPYGMATYNSDLELYYRHTLYGRKLFNCINEASGKKWRIPAKESKDLLDSRWLSTKNNGVIKLLYNYAYRLQIRNLFGIYSGTDGKLHKDNNWYDYRSKLLATLSQFIHQMIVKIDFEDNYDLLIDLKQIFVELFCNIIIVKTFNPRGILSLRLKGPTVEDSFGVKYDPNDPAAVKSLANASGVSSGYSSLGKDDLGRDIYDITLALNENNYKSEILFSYKILEGIVNSGGTISYKNTILGRTPSNKNVTYNFSAPGAIDTLILAGSRSGKGVLTLNILSTLIASNCPVCYLDYKPDMSVMLWQLEKRLIAEGHPDTKIFSIDSAVGTSRECTPNRGGTLTFSQNTEESIKNINNLLLIPWIKGITLMAVAAYCRQSYKAGLNPEGPKLMFILDEAQNFNKVLSNLKGELNNIKGNKAYVTKKKNSDGTTVNESAPIKVYAEKLLSVIDNLAPALADFRNTSGGSGNVGLIMLGQQADASAWSQGAIKRDAIGFLVGNCSCKILGKDSAGSTKYEMNGVKAEGKDALPGLNLIGGMGYFVKIEGSLATKNNSTVFKSSLILNENDYDPVTQKPGKFTGGILKNVSDALGDEIKEKEFCIENTKEIRKTIGFPGMIEFIGEKMPGFYMSEALSAGYHEIEKILLHLGILGEGNPFNYNYVEDYLFDGSIGSLLSFDTFKRLLVNDLKVADILAEDESLGVSISEESIDDIDEDAGFIFSGAVSFDEPEEPTDDSIKNLTDNSDDLDSVDIGDIENDGIENDNIENDDIELDSTLEGFTPISSTDSTLEGFTPISSTDSTLEGFTPISSTDSTLEGFTPISSTDSTLEGFTPISSTDSTLEGFTPISSTDSTLEGFTPISSTDSTLEGFTPISGTTNINPESQKEIPVSVSSQIPTDADFLNHSILKTSLNTPSENDDVVGESTDNSDTSDSSIDALNIPSTSSVQLDDTDDEFDTFDLEGLLDDSSILESEEDPNSGDTFDLDDSNETFDLGDSEEEPEEISDLDDSNETFDLGDSEEEPEEISDLNELESDSGNTFIQSESDTISTQQIQVDNLDGADDVFDTLDLEGTFETDSSTDNLSVSTEPQLQSEPNRATPIHLDDVNNEFDTIDISNLLNSNNQPDVELDSDDIFDFDDSNDDINGLLDGFSVQNSEINKSTNNELPIIESTSEILDDGDIFADDFLDADDAEISEMIANSTLGKSNQQTPIPPVNESLINQFEYSGVYTDSQNQGQVQPVQQSEYQEPVQSYQEPVQQYEEPVQQYNELVQPVVPPFVPPRPTFSQQSYSPSVQSQSTLEQQFEESEQSSNLSDYSSETDDYQDTSASDNQSPEEPTYIYNSGFEEGNINTDSAYSIKGNITFITPNKRLQQVGLNKDNSVIISVYDDPSVDVFNGLFKSPQGTDYELKRRWEMILKRVATSQNPSTITKVIICNDLLLFNKKQIACFGVLGGSEGIEVRDIVNFSKLHRYFPNIKELTVDTDIFNAMYMEFGDQIISSAFRLFKLLQTFGIIEGSNTRVVTRQTFDNMINSNAVDTMSKKAKLKTGLDSISALSNSSSNKSKGVKAHRISVLTDKSQGRLGEAMRSNFSSFNPRGIGAGSVAIAGTLFMNALKAPFRFGCRLLGFNA